MDKINHAASTKISSHLEQLSGHIERITYHSEDTGFCVLKIKTTTHRDLITVVGHAMNIGIGENIEADGIWINTASYGLQFKAVHMRTIQPTSIEGIEKYLSSGMIRGIGPHFAHKLVQAFADKVFDVIDKEPQRLHELSGIGKKRIDVLLASWAEQKNIRSIMVFLQAHGIGTARAVRIYKTYGDNAIAKVRENPYSLAADVFGIGFKTADELAQRLGIATDSLIRVRAGLHYALQEICNQGHCAAETSELVKTTQTLLGIDEKVALIEEALAAEIKARNLVVEEIAAALSHAHKQIIYLAPLYTAEVMVAKHLARLQLGVLPWGDIDSSKAIPWVEQLTGLCFSDSQRVAVASLLQHKVSVITGGPGVGKTTIVNSIIRITKTKGVRVMLCAPTGRAAKRLHATTGIPAKTIHRLLKFDPTSRVFVHDANNPLVTDFLIVDEASMIDIILMNSLLRAIPSHAAVLIVGDIDQLPSVGPGAVLADIIKSQTISTTKLTKIFRQAAHSRIIVNAHRINQGELPLYDRSSGSSAGSNQVNDKNNSKDATLSDFYFIPCVTPEEIQSKLIYVVTQRIPEKFGFNPLTDIQVLTPMNRGGLGTRSLNLVLQEKLNAAAIPKLNKFGWVFAPGDKVMQIVNNYDKDVFNGDNGTITTIDVENSIVAINFDDTLVEYRFDELDELSLAYAASIHKSQGSEYPVVVIPLAMQHYMMLARNLIYTAVTRGKKLVVLIGQTKALVIAVRNNKYAERLTNLEARLRENIKEAFYLNESNYSAADER